MRICSEKSPLHVNTIIYTELLVPEPDLGALGELPDVYETRRSQLPWACAALAAKAFALYRQRGGARLLPLPDFCTGAHAAVSNLRLLTRDPTGYRDYFPRLALIGPPAASGKAR